MDSHQQSSPGPQHLTERDSDVEPEEFSVHSVPKKRHPRQKRRRRNSHAISKRIRRSLGSAHAPPRHVHALDWRQMLILTQEPSIMLARHPSDGQLDKAPRRESLKPSNSMEKLPSAYGGSTCSLAEKRRAPSSASTAQAQWISEVFQKRECCDFIASSKDPDKCGCGRWRNQHSANALHYRAPEVASPRKEHRWLISRHTEPLPTDAFGTIEFQGGPHPHKAQYLRLAFDSNPSDIMDLFEKVWQIPPPKLIITVHGGISNFDLQLKLARVFRKGLLKAAKTTGAWIITSGINAGVVRHVAAALEGAMSLSSKYRPRITCIGIAPWGLLKKRDDFVGEDKVVSYHPHSFSPKGRFAVLNNRHSYYLLVDNGTVGRYGADIILRRQLEGYIVKKQKIDGGERSVPVVCVLLEGGTCTIRTVLDYVTNYPRVPVVVCDGSGRASDLLAFAHQHVTNEGTLPEGIRPQLLALIKQVFGYDQENAQCLLVDILSCVRQKNLMTVFRLGENQKQDVDYAILTALLKGHNLKPPEQLALALAWNRVDIARSDVFVMGQDWPTSVLHDAMMEALIHNRVDFVRLLLENGVCMEKFLTIERLERLYNTEHGPTNTLFYIVRDVARIVAGYRYNMPHIGLAIEKLMGNGYRSYYTSSEFREHYADYQRQQAARIRRNSQSTKLHMFNPADYLAGPLAAIANGIGGVSLESDAPPVTSAPSGSRALSNHILWRSAYRQAPVFVPAMSTPPTKDTVLEIDEDSASEQIERSSFRFRYPFSDLLLWAVLTKRQDMALFMWEHGEEAMAKALVACKLYKGLSNEAAEDYLEVEICDELRTYAEEFRVLSLDLLDCCYKHDDMQTLQLLTYELTHWGHETCLSLAVMVNNKAFIAHPCCQILLADLWHGGLRIRSKTHIKVILGLLFPPYIFFLDFKSREELMKQPQTAAEHEDDINDSVSTSSDESTSSSSSSDSSDEDAADVGKLAPPARRRLSTTSNQSTNFPYLFQSRRRRRHDNGGERGTAAIDYNRESSVDAARPHATSVSIVSNQVPMEGGGSRRRVRTLSHRAKVGTSESRGISVDSSAHSRPEEHRKPERRRSMLTNLQRKLTRGAKEPDKPSRNLFKKVLPERFTGKHEIKFRRKIYEFFVAPITTFWSWFLSYMLFLLIYSYVVLVATPVTPAPCEWLLLAYFANFGIELVRKIVMSEPKRFMEKIVYFFSNWWNSITFVSVLMYFVGAGFRFIYTSDLSVGRCILAVGVCVWVIKCLDYLSVHPKLGLLVTMTGKMILNMIYVVILLIIAMLSFGLTRQSIMFPDEEWHWLLVRNVFYKPYFMLYGEVYADEIDSCGDTSWDGHIESGTTIGEFNGNNTIPCVEGHWIVPLLMSVFLLISNLLLISMLIANFNHIYDEMSRISQHIWLFQRYQQVMEYEATPFLPPPFTFIYHAYMLLKFLRHHFLICAGLRNSKKCLFDFSLKLFLNHDQVEKLHDFEEECMDDRSREKEYQKNRSNEERLHRTTERTDMILVRMNDLVVRDSSLKANVVELETRFEMMENRQAEILDCLKQLTGALPAIVSSLQPRTGTPVTTEGYFAQSRVTTGHSEPAIHEHMHAPTTASSQTTIVETGVISSSEQQLLSDTTQEAPAGPRRTRTTTISGHEMGTTQTAPATASKLFGSILSLDKNVFATASPAVKNSIRRRPQQQHFEYTSITDGIELQVPPSARVPDFHVSPPRTLEHEQSGLRTEEEEEEDDDDDDFVAESDLDLQRVETPTSALHRAKPSFVRRQNTLLKEYEEAVGGPLGSPDDSEVSSEGRPRTSTMRFIKSTNGSDQGLQFAASSPKSSVVTVIHTDSPLSSPDVSPSKRPLLRVGTSETSLNRSQSAQPPPPPPEKF